MILDRHEIINDAVGIKKFTISYCPLTGTGICWNRIINGSETTFGVSGLLYNTNLVPFDRKTNSNWSQIRLECVNGELIGEPAETYMVLETTYGTWKTMYPLSLVETLNTGHNRNYGDYPYGDYRTNHSSLIFPISNEDNRLQRKDRVHGLLVNGIAKAYSLKKFSNKIEVFEDLFQGKDLLIVGSKKKDFIVSFELDKNPGNNLTFSAVQDELPIVVEDNNGNKYDVFGKIVEGPDIGSRLKTTKSFMGYWFAWATFYPGIELY